MQEADRAGVLYYARERQYKHVHAEVSELVRRHGPDPVLEFWKAYSLVMEERESEAMRVAEIVQDSRDVSLAAKMLLIYAHKKCKIVDREAVQQLEMKIRSERTSSGEQALYNAACFLWLTGRHDKSREYADRLLKVAPGSSPGLSLRGWIDLTSGRDVLVVKSIKYFEEATAVHTQHNPSSPLPVDILSGKCQFYYLRYNFSHALEHANLAVASYPRFLPALVEKMRVLLSLQDWDQAVETAQRCLSHDASCVEAYRVQILELLARSGDYQEATTMLGDLTAQLDKYEPHTHWLYHQVALSAARLAGGNSQILQATMALVERAISLAPSCAVYINELAYQLLLSGQVDESLATYKKAFSADETSIEALAGVIHCQIISGEIEEAEQQLEFLAEVQSTIGKRANLLYLNVLLALEKGRPDMEIMGLLQESRDVHIAGMKGEPFGCRYFELYNPEFLLWIARALLACAPAEPSITPAQAHPSLFKAATLLETLLKAAPALCPALLLLARVKLLSGEVLTSQTCLTKCIKLDPNSTDAHLLMAQVHLHLGSPRQSLSSLEVALSRSFEVQSSPLYHLISGRVHRALGNMSSARSALETALRTCTSTTKKKVSRASVMAGGRGAGGRGRGELGPSQVATVYLELVAVLTKLGKQHEAAKVMQDAINEFSGTSEEFRISIANADLAVERGDIEQALSMLKTVTPDKPYYIQAKEKMAALYLNHSKDRRLYIACFKELADKMPGSPTALLLGDAHMNIQEPEQALAVYERALKRNPRDSVLASKVGQALVKTHHYTKAISYYEAALKSEGMHFLRSDLAELYVKLKHFDRAEKTIHTALKHKDDSMDLERMCGDADLLLVLARVREKAGRQMESLQALEQARDIQAKVLKRVSVEQADSVQEHKKTAASIACQLAKANTEAKDWVTGLQYYREALLHCDSDTSTRLALAEVLMTSGDSEQCEHECMTVLKTDPTHQGAVMLMADIQFRRGNYEKALEHYRNILAQKSDNFPALANMVELCRRIGKLADALPYVDQAHDMSTRSDPGLTYCRGLLKWYESASSEALQLFNEVRRDPEWGHRALVNMVEICLSDTFSGETLKTTERESSAPEEQAAALQTAQKLLKETRPKSHSEEVRVQLLQNFVLLATRTKVNVEQALSRFMEMASGENDNVTALLGVATGHMILKQTPRARNQLKRMAKMPWNPQEAESFERGWLLLADVYIQAGKHDMALELLKKCRQYNQGCCRAWEYLGFVSEKEQAYRDAAANYEKAWKYSNHANPAVGYKLAFNYLKAKRLVDAIDVCHTVLRRHPHYPKIQQDILDKARQGIRV